MFKLNSIVAASALALLSSVLACQSASAAITGYTATNDATRLFYKLTKNSNYSFHRVYMDADQNSATGFSGNGVGADYLLENGNLYKYSGTGADWSWTLVKAVNYSAAASAVQWTVNRADVGESAMPNGTNLVFQVEAPLETSPVFTHTYAATTTTVTYSADPGTIFANPERGFYHSNGDCNYDLPTLQAYRNTDKISLVFCTVDLGTFKTANISQAQLDALNNNLALIRQAGLKAIVRFGYSWTSAATTTPGTRDTTKAWMLTHINQLTPYIQNNSDVIATLQTGLIGVWGEWYYTDYFGDQGVISPAQWLDRQEVTDALLNALPASRSVQLRTPAFKQHFYGTTALTSSEAFTNTYKARVGHHNDCFLASADDYGTYTNVTADKNYLSKENLFVPQGGETCQPSAYSTWSKANADMSKLRYSFLNVDYHTGVLDSWGSNINVAKRKLGYRFNLVQGTYSNSVNAGGTLSFNLQVANGGYATPYNPRDVNLVLRNASNGTLYRFKLNSDPRRWLPNQTKTISQNIVLTGVPKGSYELLLSLPDPMPLLSNRAEYAIRVANTGAWEEATGFNKLNYTLVVK